MARRLVGEELAGFLESGISVLVGTRDGRLFPEAMRGVGVRVEPEVDEVVVLLPVATAATTLANLRDNGRIAVCLARALDHRSVQLKGAAVEIRDADERDRPTVDRWRAGVARDWGRVGMPPRLTFRITHWPCHAVRVRVESVFDQTPGPGAGEPLERAREVVP